MPLKISISGVRGTVPDSLTPEVCLYFAKAFGTYLGGGTVAIGTDSRSSSEFIKGIVFSGLLSTGCNIIDLGICPTPTVGVMVRELEVDAGMVITASHNPLPWNGFKFMRGDGIFLNENQAKNLLKIYDTKQFTYAPAKGVTIDHSAIAIHIKKVLKAVPPFFIRRKKFKVAVDACNGAGSVALIKLLEKLGCKIFAINCDPRQSFPHPPEPTPEHLVELAELVRSKKADVGFAMDSDADRLAVISDQGEAVGEEATLALTVKYMLSKNITLNPKKKIVVVNLSTSRLIDDICHEYGAMAIRTKVGEVHVSEELKALKGFIGGEGNGGVIFPKVGFNRDSLSGAALILSYLAASGKKLSALIKELPHYEMAKTKVECSSLEEANDFIDHVKENFNGEDMILTEGVKVVFPDSWIHVRASNTEPIIRLMAEARSLQQAEALIMRAMA